MIQGRRKLRARVRGLTRTQGKVVVGIGASRQGSSLLVSCAVTRDQLHRQVAMGPGGMHDGQSVGATAIKETLSAADAECAARRFVISPA